MMEEKSRIKKRKLAFRSILDMLAEKECKQEKDEEVPLGSNHPILYSKDVQYIAVDSFKYILNRCHQTIARLKYILQRDH